MTAKEQLLARAPGWSEEQAERALLAADETAQPLPGDASATHSVISAKLSVSAVLARAASFRARQTTVADATSLVREARDELEQRTS